MNAMYFLLSEAFRHNLRRVPHPVMYKIITDKLGRTRKILTSPKLKKGLKEVVPTPEQEIELAMKTPYHLRHTKVETNEPRLIQQDLFIRPD